MMAAAISKTRKIKAKPEILTLAEAAKYLRVSEKILRRMATDEIIPARKFGAEWRFLRSALQDWMRWGPSLEGLVLPRWIWQGPATNDNGEFGTPKEELMKLAGVWKNDPTVEEMVKEIYRQRKQHMIEN